MAIRDERGYVNKSLTISSWDCDTGATYQAAHGLSATEWKTIIDIQVVIFNNANTFMYDLKGMHGAGVLNGGVESVDSTNINLDRTATGTFDNPNFNAATGTITFKYLPD